MNALPYTTKISFFNRAFHPYWETLEKSSKNFPKLKIFPVKNIPENLSIKVIKKYENRINYQALHFKLDFQP